MLKTVGWKDIKELRVLGRTDYSNEFLPLFSNGSAVEICVDGTELWIDVDVDCDFFEPWVFTEINGSFMSRQMLLPGKQSICLFRNMDPSIKKTIKFTRELQAMHEDDRCHLFVEGFKTNGEFYPLTPYDYKLEFIGDSITSGEGTYGAVDDTDWLSMYMSYSNTYVNLICKNMNAEPRLISQGGFGVFCGWDNQPESNIPMYYEKVCGLGFSSDNNQAGAHNAYDFSSWVPDAIIVNLGTNDTSAFNTPAFTDPKTGISYKQRRNEDGTLNAEDIEKVKKAVVDFLKMIRKHNQTSHIVWAYGMLGYDFNMEISDAINRYIAEAGDHNVKFLNVPNTTKETYGSHGHPGFAAHVKAAAVLEDYLRSVLD